MKPKSYFLTGIGTDVGKTVVSSILVNLLKADYWKPIQAGDLHFTDSMKIKKWCNGVHIHPERYRLAKPMSPHAAAERDNVEIHLKDFCLPNTENHLIVEGAGGLLVPLNDNQMIIDLIEYLQIDVVLVSQHYLGSINHTLLSIEALLNRQIPIAGIIFNGDENKETESIITSTYKIKVIGRIPEVENLNNPYDEFKASENKLNIV